jgi:thiol-disulfide isomerase/thioredoxin
MSATPKRGRWLALAGILAGGTVLAGVVALGLGQPERAGTGDDATAASHGGTGSDTAAASPATTATEGAFPIVVYRGADTLGARELDFSQLLGTGTPVVLNFWAGQCPPCRAEMPDFQAVYDRYADEFLLVGVDIGPFIGLGTRESAIELLDELDITYPTAYALDSRAVQDNDVLGMPTTIFYDGAGEVVTRHTGLLTEQAFEARVREAIEATS